MQGKCEIQPPQGGVKRLAGSNIGEQKSANHIIKVEKMDAPV
jgi:hypothetical protein